MEGATNQLACQDFGKMGNTIGWLCVETDDGPLHNFMVEGGADDNNNRRGECCTFGLPIYTLCMLVDTTYLCWGPLICMSVSV